MINQKARMHTVEHILTAVMRQMFSSPRNLEMHLGEKKSKCDYAVPRALSDEDIAGIEGAVNEEVMRDDQVVYETLPVETAEGMYDLWKVPAGAETIRIVHIGDFDATPCSGEHVERMFPFPKSESRFLFRVFSFCWSYCVH